MALPVSFVNYNYLDSTINNNGIPESASFELPIITLTAANLVATTGLITALTDAIEDIVLGNLGKETITLSRTIVDTTPADDQLAQRGIKLLCRYHQASVPALKFRVSIPTFDLSLLPLHSEFLDLTAGVGLALKTAFEAVVRSPDAATEVVVLDSAQYID